MDEINLEQIKPAKGKIIIIDRRPCISHPRNKGIGNNNSTLKENLTTNFDTLKEDIIEKVNNVTSVHIIQLEKYTFLQQIYILRSAHIIIGYHGAALTHIMFLEPKIRRRKRHKNLSSTSSSSSSSSSSSTYVIEYYSKGKYGGSDLNFFNALHKWTNVPLYKLRLETTTSASYPTTLTDIDIQNTIDYITLIMKKGSN